MKISSRDILDVLRRYHLANNDNVPRNIESVKISHPNPTNTLALFCFLGNRYYLLFDDNADDDVDYILTQIQANNSGVKGQLVQNPVDNTPTCAMPFKGKGCYLYKVISDKNRLDIELAKRYPETSRSTWQKHIKAGHVSINGVVAESSKQDVKDIDSIAINTPEMPDFSKNELPIVFIDDNVIVINKPSGVLSHAKGALSDEFTVAEFFRRYTTYNLDTNRPGIVHRLDRDTSGVLIGARNHETATMLQKQFADRKVKKTYYGILDGIPKLSKANIDLPIGRNPSAPSTFRVDSNGKSAQTSYEVILSNNKYCYAKLQPQTGRTHQLRVHMKYINTPILGDRLYGNVSKRLYLHAASLEITIPNGNRQIFIASLPPEFTEIFPLAKV